MADKSVYERFGTSALPTQQSRQRKYICKGGETLSSIAAEVYATGYSSELWRQIGEFNGIYDLDALPVGTVLIIPAPSPTE